MFSRTPPREHLAARELPGERQNGAANDLDMPPLTLLGHPIPHDLQVQADVLALLTPLDGPTRTRVLEYVATILNIDPPEKA